MCIPLWLVLVVVIVFGSRKIQLWYRERHMRAVYRRKAREDREGRFPVVGVTPVPVQPPEPLIKPPPPARRQRAEPKQPPPSFRDPH